MLSIYLNIFFFEKGVFCSFVSDKKTREFQTDLEEVREVHSPDFRPSARPKKENK